MNAAGTTNVNSGNAEQELPRSRDRAWLVSLAVVCLGFLPILSVFFRQQWQRPEYQAFPLMLVFAAWMLVTRIQAAKPVDRSRWWISLLGWGAMVVSLLVLGVSFWLYSPWLAMIAFVIYAFGVACFIWQNWILDGLWGIWFLLVLLVPPPLDRDQLFIESLQLFSSRVTSMLLDVFGVLHVMQGNVLNFPDRQLFVDQACSGIVSLISIVYCIAMYSVWQRRRFWHSAVLIAAGVGWTILMNSIRLLTIGLAWAWLEMDLAVGVPHKILSAVMFGITVGVVVVLDRLLQAILAPIDVRWRIADQAKDQAVHPGLSLMRIWDEQIANREPEPDDDTVPVEESPGDRRKFSASMHRLTGFGSTFGLPAVSCFGLMGALYLGFFGVQETLLKTAVNRSIDRALAMTQELDPGQGTDLKLKGFSNARRELFRWDLWGQYSRTWFYKDETGVEYILSCDFLFGPNWHDLRICYRGTGWKIENEDVVRVLELGVLERESPQVDSSLTAPNLCEQFEIAKKFESGRGLVTYGAFRATGEWFNRPRGSGMTGDFWAHIVQGRDRAEQADYYQVQVSTDFEGELSREQKQTAELLLKTALEKLQKELVVDRSALRKHRP